MPKPERRYFNFNPPGKLIPGVVKKGSLQRPAGVGIAAYRDEIGDALGLSSQGPGISINLAECTQEFTATAAYNATVANADLLFKNVQLNHDRDLTYNLSPHLHWFQAKNYTPNFLFGYRYQILGGVKATAWTLIPCITTVFAYPGGTIHQLSHSASIVVPGASALSDIIQFRIYRDTGNVSGLFAGADPYNTGGNTVVGVLSFDVHIRIDQVGSTTEYIK